MCQVSYPSLCSLIPSALFKPFRFFSRVHEMPLFIVQALGPCFYGYVCYWKHARMDGESPSSERRDTLCRSVNLSSFFAFTLEICETWAISMEGAAKWSRIEQMRWLQGQGMSTQIKQDCVTNEDNSIRPRRCVPGMHPAPMSLICACQENLQKCTLLWFPLFKCIFYNK